MAAISYAGATLTHPGAERPSVDGLDLEIADGEFLVLVGPSGCGKSTSLRMLAGLDPVTAGSIRIGGQDVTSTPAHQRDVAMVFQSYALYPHMTVRQNMTFGLRIAGLAKPEVRSRVEQAATMLDLTPYLDRKPSSLSGGQRQRVAMGRAIVRRPQVFLMDEPLSNLDAALRTRTRTEIVRLQRELGTTTVYVTHDQVEAMTMADRVAVLADGVLQQVDTPQALYDRPVNTFVAGFIGSPAMNMLDAAVTPTGLQWGVSPLDIAPDLLAGVLGAGHRRVTVGVRPEALVLSGTAGIPAQVEVVESLGAEGQVLARPSDATVQAVSELLTVRVPGRGLPAVGDHVRLGIDPGQVHLFHHETGRRLP
ncbi:ABC transporter ATP-binding protein [Modestobacter sp. Leaf380]|uniref:ABC transporter ATP-binding protein n=1 Tax=Modestobacter sp. Leaf380 TaxID=1736356 RepID=UPI0006F49F78|nr:sn-glycerol-3-phosphate ABC transporter ATP-binding protein UgpC [Modestobacter sp. Leaf380]KQS68257.1 sugar ABC transporter ATP-binding protein [Modestobacter sp. Leaf380]